MCLFLDLARPSNTVIINIPVNENEYLRTEKEAEDFQGVQQRLFIYKNDVVSIAKKSEYNCMILTIPDVADMGKLRFIDPTNKKTFIDVEGIVSKVTDYINPQGLISRGGVLSKGIDFRTAKVGKYEVFYSNDFPTLLEKVNMTTSEGIKKVYSWYPKESVFFAFRWKGKEPISAQPIVIEYGSLSGLPVIPVLDSHDGSTPKVDAINHLNHTIITEAPVLPKNTEIPTYEITVLGKKRVWGIGAKGNANDFLSPKNNDFFVSSALNNTYMPAKLLYVL